MQVLGCADNVTPQSSLAAHTPDIEANKGGVEEIFKDPVGSVAEELCCKKVPMLLFDVRDYECKNIWPPISQAGEVTNPLRAASRRTS